MAARTFVPQVVRLLHKTCNYIAKHQAKLAVYLTPTQLGYLNAVVAACNVFTNSVVVPVEQP